MSDTIFTKNIRFPNLDKYEDNPVQPPTWIEDIKVEYDENQVVDGHGKYVVKRLHGPAAGSTSIPVYMDANGQPKPVRSIDPSLVKAGELVIREDSPFLTITKTTEEEIDPETEEVIENTIYTLGTDDTVISKSGNVISILNNFRVNNLGSISARAITLTSNATVGGDLSVTGNTTITGNATVAGDIKLVGKLKEADGTEQGTIYYGSDQPDANSNAMI